MSMANTNHNDQLIRQSAKEQLSQLNQIRLDNQLNFDAAEFLQWIDNANSFMHHLSKRRQ